MAALTPDARGEIGRALVKLMLEKDLERITVKELLACAQVNRSTYYYHFHRIGDVLDWLVSLFTEEVTARLTYGPGSERPADVDLAVIARSTEAIYQFVYDNRAIASALLGSSRADEFRRRFVTTIRRCVEGYNWTFSDVQSGEAFRLTNAQRSYAAYQSAGAVWAFVECWAARSFQETPAQMSETIMLLNRIQFEGMEGVPQI